MLNVKYEICIEISCKNWSKIFFAVLSLGSDKKIDKIGTVLRNEFEEPLIRLIILFDAQREI